MRPREISNFEFRIFHPPPHRPGIPEQPGRVGPRVAEVYRGYNSRVVDENRHLPVIEDGLDDEAPVCSPTNYVSNEEASLLASMRRLREKSMVVRRDLKDADPEDRARLEAELEELREEWRTLAKRRERAYVNKMIALGHLPPEADSP
jgi:hypothetical protein